MPFLLFNGALNQLVFGLQLYFWVMLALFIGVVASYAAWYVLFWQPLKPLHGHFFAHVRKEFNAFVFNFYLKFVLKSEKEAKLLYNETIKEARLAQPDWEESPSGRMGRVQTDLIFDAHRWTEIGSPARNEIDKVVEVWNEAEKGKDEIHTLIKFSRYLQEGKIACPIDKTITVPWLRIRAAIFTPKTTGKWQGYIGQLAERLKKDQKSEFMMYGIYVLIFCALICVMMIGTKALHLI